MSLLKKIKQSRYVQYLINQWNVGAEQAEKLKKKQRELIKKDEENDKQE